MQSILFTNWTDKPFTHTWDKEEFTFQPGQSIYLQAYLANHFAKHLANRELIKKGKVGDTDFTIYVGNEDSLVFKEYCDKALSNPLSATSAVKAEVDAINKNEEVSTELPKDSSKKFCDQCDSKGVKHKKDCPTLKTEKTESSDDEEFEGLKEE